MVTTGKFDETSVLYLSREPSAPFNLRVGVFRAVDDECRSRDVC
jgi:hypothetical protein